MLSNSKKLAKLPASAGVYFFKDKDGKTIYIGKSGNLKIVLKATLVKELSFLVQLKSKC